MSKPTNDATGPAPEDHYGWVEGELDAGKLQAGPVTIHESVNIHEPVGHYAILDRLVVRCVDMLEQQQQDASLGQIGVNVTMAATTSEDGNTVPALLYLFLADGAVYGQALMTTILDANLRPDQDRLASVVNSALDEIRRQQSDLVESLVGEPAE